MADAHRHTTAITPHRASRHAKAHAPDHIRMLRDMRAPWLWTNASVVLLGLWLVSSPWTFGYRSPAMTWSDVVSGVLLIVLAAAAFAPRCDVYGRWGVALVGWLLSRYLAAYQLGYVDRMWEPFFGEGTLRVLTSDVSKMWPISDAGLGATAYTFEMLMAWMGGRTRWRTMPWMVTFFFILVVPLGITSIVLVILQPLVVGYWCTICLLTAVVMLVMIPFTVDEVVAMGQFMAGRVRAGKPFWWTFFVGDTTEGGGPDARTPRYGSPLASQIPASAWGVTVPVPLALSVLVGIWLMFAPGMLGSTAMGANSDRLVGALIVTVAAISTAEVVRAFRFLNGLFAVWLLIAPWALVGASTAARWCDMA